MSLPILTVVAALGNQGRGVVSTYIADNTPQFHVRALTSNTSSPAAKALAAKDNVSVVQVDLNSEDSIVSAFEGSAYIFANASFDVATFLEKGAEAAKDLEAKQRLNIVHAASKTSTLQHLVWSTLPDGLTASEGRLNVPHFQSKVPANEYIWSPESGLSHKTTHLTVSMYGSNLLRKPWAPVPTGNANELMVQLPCDPDVRFPFAGEIDTNIGLFTKTILAQPETTKGQYVSCTVDLLSCREWCAMYERVLRSRGGQEQIVFGQCSLEEYEKTWGELGTEIGIMMVYFNEFKEHSIDQATRGLQPLKGKDLGIEAELRSTEEYMQTMDWEAEGGLVK